VNVGFGCISAKTAAASETTLCEGHRPATQPVVPASTPGCGQRLRSLTGNSESQAAAATMPQRSPSHEIYQLT